MKKSYILFLFLITITFVSGNIFSQDIHEEVVLHPKITEKELYRVTTSDKSITAIWVGVDQNVELERSDMPLTFGVQKLFFEFSNTNRKILFQPKGELYFSDWTFKIFSPDNRFVVLLQDHYGPYHIIPIENLQDYLLGNNPPIEIVSGQTPDWPGVIHGKIKWLSSDTVEFYAACCGGSYKVVHQIGGKTKYDKWKAGEKPIE